MRWKNITALLNGTRMEVLYMDIDSIRYKDTRDYNKMHCIFIKIRYVIKLGREEGHRGKRIVWSCSEDRQIKKIVVKIKE